MISTLNIVQSIFITPPIKIQGRMVTNTIPLWLSNSMSKKHSLEPVSMSVKDIVTKYDAHTLKRVKVKNDVHLIKDPIMVKVIVEVSTYR